MENHRRQKPNSTGDMFTFPSMSPDSNFKSSELADQLFSNGTFLLHAFPVQPPTFTIPKSLILSRTSSISSKDSLMSSRSNSTNSISSCSSGRTSSSEGSSRRINITSINQINQSRSVAVKSINTSSKECQSRIYCNNYGNSQRWQFISPVPVLNRRNSSKKRKGRKGKNEREVRKGVCRRLFGWLVSTCQECHAIEPSKRLKVSI